MLVVSETIAKTDTGRQRRENEDSMLARAPVFVVADGMGGAQAGEVASRIAIDAFRQGLPDSGSAEERLATRVHEANQRIYEVSRSEHERAGMGTTLTAAYLGDSQMAIAHVGDSRAYLFRSGTLTRLTQDHSLVEELVKRGKLTQAQAAEHPQRSIITRALGPEPTVEVDTRTHLVHDGDIVLLCSDGLTSMITEERVAEVLGRDDSLERAAQQLIDDANQAGGRDNITVILFRVQEVAAEDSSEEPTVVGVRAPELSASQPTVQETAPPADTPPGAEAPGPPAGAAAGAGALAPPVARADAVVARGAPTALVERTVGPPGPPPLQQSGQPPAAPQGRQPRRYAKPLAALLATVIVLFLIGAGGYLASRQLYFLGTNPQGIVTIYRGLPYDLPAGVRLYETFYVSGVPAALVPADRRNTLFNHQLRSETDAEALVHDLELGQLSK